MNADPYHRSPLCDSHREEVASLYTHAAGVVLSIFALVAMALAAEGDLVRLVSAGVFGISLILLYLSSTLYHFFTSARWKSWFQALDHACIYLLIAGSYTPVTLITLRGPLGWSLFGIVWGLALAGVLVKTLAKRRRDHWISTVLYVLMGWLILAAIVPLVRALPAAGFWWLFAGGLCYTGGLAFFAWKRLPFHHAIWHLFVMAGSTCHVIAIHRFVIS